ncbi:MAG: hypothetical protein CM15mP84_00070 [Cellvibrionales bacterium]|nr:MAG: hypothetical protein CM15mP84_00070 [Cellvibrionales bacterium]
MFSVLISLTLPALYIMPVGAWLLIKTEDELFDKAAYWCRLALPPMAFALLLVSIMTPLVSQDIADRWFKLPDAIGLLPIPELRAGDHRSGLMLRRPAVLHAGYGWFIFVALMVICLMAAIGLAYSIYSRHCDRTHDLVGGCGGYRVTAIYLLGSHRHTACDIGGTLFISQVFPGQSHGAFN